MDKNLCQNNTCVLKSRINKLPILAKIPSQLLTKESTTKLALKEQPYILLIPKSIIQNHGLMRDQFSFDLLVNGNNKLVLIESQEHPNETKI